MSFLSLRIAEPSQAGLIVDFLNRTIHGGPYSGRSIDGEHFARLLQKGKFLLAKREETLVGCVYVEPRAVGPSLLEFLVVTPQLRRSGIGSQLIEAAEGVCRNTNSKYLQVQVDNLNRETARFCRRRGYVEFDGFSGQRDSRSPCDCQPLKMVKHLHRIGRGF